jgi:plasmid stabilization system protein ParE
VRIEFLTPAREEFLAGVNFYESQARGLGEEFILDVEASLKLIADFPHLGSPGPAGTERIHLRRFPYSVVYRLEESLLRVIAVEHQRRRPFFWRDRV